MSPLSPQPSPLTRLRYPGIEGMFFILKKVFIVRITYALNDLVCPFGSQLFGYQRSLLTPHIFY